MRKTHEQDIKRNPHACILATAHNCSNAQELNDFASAVVKLASKIRDRYKKYPRPWFAKFSKDGHITKIETVT